MPKKDLYIRTYKIMFAEYPDVVNVKKVSRMLGIGRDKVYKLVKTGEIQKIPCTRSIKVPKANVIEYILRCI